MAICNKQATFLISAKDTTNAKLLYTAKTDQ